ncbi:short-chain dehydrogenase [Streptomyces avermitilis]|uniref:Short-chain dehydrogenase n=1 Tax=Streptomyces avermitilis TaxID=33903 RepID=A0A4D4LUL3_STRAX|nr:short-chain dehydrogenase [Streptomyces avermitilis]
MAVHHRTRSADDVVALVRESGGAAIALRADLTDEAECRRLVRAAAEWGGGRLTALVNNAGVQPTQALPGMTAAQWRAVLDTNLSSVFACTQAAAEVMRANGDGDGVGDGAGAGTGSWGVPGPGQHHAHRLHRGPSPRPAARPLLRVQGGRRDARPFGGAGVRAVRRPRQHRLARPHRPRGSGGGLAGGVRRWQQAVPTGRLGRPEDIGDACVFLASPLASWITGHDLVVDGGVSARPTW